MKFKAELLLNIYDTATIYFPSFLNALIRTSIGGCE